MVLVLVVVAAASTGDRYAGIVAALSSGVWFDAFLTEPYGRFTITDPHDIEITVLLVLVGVAVTEIAVWGRRQQAGASRQVGYLHGVLETSKIIAVSPGSRTWTICCGLPTDEQIGGSRSHRGRGSSDKAELFTGRFVLTAATRVARPSVEQLRVAVLLAGQVGAALTHSD